MKQCLLRRFESTLLTGTYSQLSYDSTFSITGYSKDIINAIISVPNDVFETQEYHGWQI